MKRIIAYKWDYAEFMAKLSEQEKKTQKTPKSEIDKAIKLKNEYYEHK